MSLVNVEKPVGLIEWFVHQICKKSWVSLLMLIDFLIIGFGNPKVLTFLLAGTQGGDSLKAYPLPGNYWIYWLIAVAGGFLLIGIVAYITRPKTVAIGYIFNKDSAIKGLAPFCFDDAELFEQLGRIHKVDGVVNGLCDSGYRLGVLTGKSGCGNLFFASRGLAAFAGATTSSALCAM